jgi:F-type H+-transporting ATPase subunit c
MLKIVCDIFFLILILLNTISCKHNTFYFFFMLVQAAQKLGAGLSTSGLAGAGIGIGFIFAALLLSFARNPSIKDDLFRYAILGFALTEAIALFALMISFLILFL